MHATGAPLSPTPTWLRLCLNTCLILGILAMHHMLVADDPAHHVDTAMVTTAMQMDSPHSVVAFVAGDGHADGSMSDCCGLMMLCLAMIIGASAFLVLRRRRSDRVLWQLPPPFRLGNSLRLPPLHALTPLQRSSILRC
jgi:hypothetical protein